MSARLVLHIITTLVLFSVGWWLYMRMEENAYDAIDSINVAIYWFASLVYILFSWIFYWIAHRLKLKAWVIAQFIALIIAAVSTVVLQYISREHQRQFEQKAMQQQEKSMQEPVDVLEITSEDKPEILNLSEEGELESGQGIE
jgi:ABC-type uncharacterized transport system permease subunit